MGKKSKRKSAQGSGAKAVKSSAMETLESPTTIKIQKDCREFCPEAEEFYPMTRNVFDDEVWNEIETYWLPPGSKVKKEIAWKLLEHLRLECMQTKSGRSKIADMSHPEHIEDYQELELLYSMPYLFNIEGDVPVRVNQYWHVSWIDLVPGFDPTLCGSICCGPFFQDPPMGDPDYDTQYGTHRKGWNLRDHSDNPISLQCIRAGVGLTSSQLSEKDIARCLIPAIGVLAKYHPGNKNQVLKRTMLRFERQVRTWIPGDQSDPNAWETSETIHRRAGVLTHPKVVEDIRRENRWMAEVPDDDIPEGAKSVCLYRDEEGVQHKLVRLANGEEYCVETGAKKGGGGSMRTAMSSAFAIAAFNNTSSG